MVVLIALNLLLFAGRGFSAHAQEPERERFIDRFSFRTNAVDWLLTIPNVSVSFDLFPGEFNKMDVLLGIRYNWNTRHQLPTYYVFDVFDGRLEYRYHYRYQQLGSGEKPNLFSLKRKNPRSWVAHYIGGYANAGTFAFKVSTNGHQGFQGGVGVSFGIELPLYQYKKGAIDLDLGASVGAMYANFNLFTLNGANSAYVNNGKGWGVIPMLSEENVDDQKSRVQYYNVTPDHEEQLKKEIEKLGQKAINDLEKDLKAKANEAANAARAAQREADKEAAEKEKAEKAAAREAEKAQKEAEKAAKQAEKEAEEKAKAEAKAAKANKATNTNEETVTSE